LNVAQVTSNGSQFFNSFLRANQYELVNFKHLKEYHESARKISVRRFQISIKRYFSTFKILFIFTVALSFAGS